MYIRSLILSIAFLLFCSFQGFAQDYYPLQLGNSWIYNNIDSDGFIDDQISVSIISIDTVQSPTGLIIHSFEDYDGFDFDTSYFYSILSSPNEIYAVEDYDSVLELECEVQFNHTYIEGAELICPENEDIISTFHGDYTTINGVTFNNCWAIFEKIEFEDNERYYFFAPNIGMIALKDLINDEFPIFEIDSYDLLLSNKNNLHNTNVNIYPNPTTDILNLKLETQDQPDNLYIINTLGEMIIHLPYTMQNQIDISALKKGNYFLIGQKDNLPIWRKQFIKI